MNAIPFVVAAYAVAVLGIGGLLLMSWLGMRRTERAIETMQGER
jgi:heme exporter protein CcmD